MMTETSDNVGDVTRQVMALAPLASSVSDLESAERLLTELNGLIGKASPTLAAWIDGLIKMVTQKQTEIQAARSAEQAKPFFPNPDTDPLAATTWSLWSKDEQKTFETLKKMGDQKVELVSFDDDYKPVGKTPPDTASGNEAADDLALLKAVQRKNDPRLAAEEKEKLQKELNKKLYGNEDGPRNDAEHDEGNKKLKKAVTTVGGLSAVGKSAEEQEQAGQNVKKVHEKLDIKNTLAKQKDHAKANGQPGPPEEKIMAVDKDLSDAIGPIKIPPGDIKPADEPTAQINRLKEAPGPGRKDMGGATARFEYKPMDKGESPAPPITPGSGIAGRALPAQSPPR